MKPILKPTKFHYKGSLEALAKIKAAADKDPRVQALAASIERGKTLIGK